MPATPLWRSPPPGRTSPRELPRNPRPVAIPYRGAGPQRGRAERYLRNMGDGVAMFDDRLCLASWNGHLKQILDLPEEFLARRPSYREYLGFLATHGEFGDIDVEVELQRYLARAGQQSTTERSRPDGRVVQVRHNPVPGG